MAAKQLLGCYRTGEANDPETFGAAVAAVLSAFPLEVIRYVCDPRTGLPGTSKWMPNPAEVKAACEDRVRWLAKIDRYQNWGNPAADQKLLAADLKPKPTLDELKAKYGPNWGLSGSDPDSEQRKAEREASDLKKADREEHSRRMDYIRQGFEPPTNRHGITISMSLAMATGMKLTRRNPAPPARHEFSPSEDQ